ncbi:MAG: hypothetical protein J6M46_08620 [Lachnospiraceae bacterium]|nr:hypothetical protein [Lachnospiraceae bacterium]
MKWSDWLKAHSHTITMKVGQSFEGEGFSSDQLVVNDSLEALASGRATILIGSDVFNITVE